MKHLLTLCIALLIIYSCKKESNNPTVAGGASLSASETILTSHKWYATHDYRDTTFYASSHANDMPLATTYDFRSPYDTCSNTSKIWFKTGAHWVTIKGKKCLASEPDTSSIYSWSLSNNNSKVTMNGTVFDVLELNANKFRIATKIQQTNSSNNTLYYETIVWILEPAP